MTRLLLVLLLCGCSGISKPELYSVGCATMDIASTAYALDDGATELNPIYPSGYEVASMIVLSVVTHYGIKMALNKIYHGERAKAPTWLGYGSYRCGLAVWNISQIAEQHK